MTSAGLTLERHPCPALDCSQSAALKGLRDALPVILTLAPLGLAIGATIGKSGVAGWSARPRLVLRRLPARGLRG